MPRLIDADKLKDIISDTWILDRIDEQPTVDPMRHGHWMCSPDDSMGLCSCCHYPTYGKLYYGHYLIVPYNYCPNCGARMDGVEYE